MKINDISNQNQFKITNSIDNKDKPKESFSNLLKNSLAKVNNLEHQSAQAKEDFVLGKADNIHDVMIAGQKAKLSVDLTAAITNKAISAYKEVMRIQV